MIKALWVLVPVNVLSFLFYAVDKQRARKQKHRVRERTLLLLAAIGPVGAAVGMYALRHKTKKTAFRIIVPLCLLLHAALFVFLMLRYN